MTVVYNLKKVWGYLGKKHKDILEESISQLIQYTNLKNFKRPLFQIIARIEESISTAKNWG